MTSSSTSSSPPLTPEQQSLKAHFTTLLPNTPLDTPWTTLLTHSPRIFSAALTLHSIPTTTSHLPPKTQSLISLAIASNATFLHPPHITRHTRAALAHGASKAEIIETLCLTSTLGIHACNIGVPILCEVLREQGREVKSGMDGMGEKEWELRSVFERKRGYWHGFWEDFLRLDKGFFEAYTGFSGVPWEMEGEHEGGIGVLEPKVKELIYCAFDVSATHLYQPGLKLHMKNVLKYGGTPEEIMEVMELATLLGLSTMDVGLPILEEELRRAGREE
ncbi:carboxymuconolactone decarboxylase [Periconia macrospinosa]|uniref:Carboxymuconolactone decarboxylase n=1 Tax=Periconia macrospinosa TaxID=97972 RepID=A0A2V1E3P8_9PLEO|nr:carboxymuconolactone decarboxylase [Periconia macrospinosa]